MQQFLSKLKAIEPKYRLDYTTNIYGWILRAVILHVGLTVLINLIGRLALLPTLFNFNGVGTFASDSEVYLTEAISLVDKLTLEGVFSWLSSSSPLHLKLYSLSFALFSPLLGSTTLSVEPLNLVCYLMTLYLVFRIGKMVFDHRVGLLAATMVGLWPSFLLHTTQLLEDPLFIMAILSLVLIFIMWLMRKQSWRDALLFGFIGTMAVLLLWVIRSEMWELTVAIVIVGITFLLGRMIYERRGLLWNITIAGILLVAILMIPRAFPDVRDLDRPIILPTTMEQVVEPMSSDDRAKTTSNAGQEPDSNLLQRIVEKLNAIGGQIGALRDRFIFLYPNAGSNLNIDVRIADFDDLVRYFPRALLTGFFAPFPNMWFVSGARVGLAGRMLSGLEMMIMYVIEVLAFLCLWRKRRQMPLWLMLAIATLGMTALGLVVVNIGALYRMRYVFWMLLIVLGAGGGMHMISSWQRARETKVPKYVVSPAEDPDRKEIES